MNIKKWSSKPRRRCSEIIEENQAAPEKTHQSDCSAVLVVSARHQVVRKRQEIYEYNFCVYMI